MAGTARSEESHKAALPLPMSIHSQDLIMLLQLIAKTSDRATIVMLHPDGADTQISSTSA